MNNCIAYRRWASNCISRTNIYSLYFRNTTRTLTQITNTKRKQDISAPLRQIMAWFSCFPKDLNKYLHWKWVCCWSTTPPLAGFIEPSNSPGHFMTNRSFLSSRTCILILLRSSLKLVPLHVHYWSLCHQRINIRCWFWPLWWGQIEINLLQSMDLHKNPSSFHQKERRTHKILTVRFAKCLMRNSECISSKRSWKMFSKKLKTF